MNKEPLYILTYDHGGYVLWEKEVKPRLKDIAVWMEKYPRLRIGLDYESFAFDEFDRCDPEVIDMIRELLRKYPDRVGLGATTYGQPLSLYISEESNIRQLTYAVKTNLSFFGITPDVYCISEFALNNQTPQMIKKCGYKAAILRSHVMGYGYTKTFDKSFGMWVGKDKTGIPAVPTYDKQGRGYNCTTLDNWILSRWPRDTDISLEDFREMFGKYSPLLASRYDDLTQGIEQVTAEIEKHEDYKYVLLEDIPSLFGEPTELLEMTDNDFHSQMPWGYCGNEIFRGCREGEIRAVQAEKINALSVMLGHPSYEKKNEEAWKYILAAQHHDVTICGLLDLSRRFIPASLGYSKEIIEESLKNIAADFSHKDCSSLFAFNPLSFPVDTYITLDKNEDGITCQEDCLSDENGRTLYYKRVSLPELTAKSIKAEKDNAHTKKEAFSFNADKNELSTPYYIITFGDNGILSLYSKETEGFIIKNQTQRLLSGFINGKDEDFHGKAVCKTGKDFAFITFSGFTGSIPCRFTMTFSSFNPRIDCEIKNSVRDTDRIGRTDITENRPVPLTLNGHHHDDKLCFVADISLADDREMFRDLPFSVSQWDGQLRLTEEYWYPDDRILVDTPVSKEESFNAKTHLQGIYWVALRDKNKGLSVMNKGTMGSVVQGNRIFIPILYSNDYMCGTKILNGEYSNEFSLLPFGSSFSCTDIHKAAMTYNYSPVNTLLSPNEGRLTEYTLAQISSDSDSVILTAIHPEDGGLTARFCNFSDCEASVKFTPSKGNISAETDLLGNKTGVISENTLYFKPWEIKTVRVDNIL